MELREIITLLNSYRRLLLVGALLCGSLGLVFSFIVPVREQAMLTLYVRRAAQPPSRDFYTYDGYYSQQAAERYTDTLVGFLESWGILKQTAELAGLPTDQKSLTRLRRRITVKKVAPQLVNIRVVQTRPGRAAKLVQELAKVTKERIEELNQRGDRELAIDLVHPQPLVVKLEPKPLLDAIVGTLGGLLLSILTIAFWEYLRR